eukprot:m.1030715 g.1030715  ORF g.1030715 m.1030715 type:complete len:438 (-) comp24119_c0_seq28:667-1980(-)
MQKVKISLTLVRRVTHLPIARHSNRYTTRCASIHSEHGLVPILDAVAHTPAVVVLYDSLLENIASHQQHIAGDLGIAIRPHVKSHKSLEIARLQLDAGAEGITCSKATEGITFLENRICRSLTFAYPMLSEVHSEKIFALAKETASELWFTVDSMNVLRRLHRHAQAHKYPAKILVKIDTGLGRCGVTNYTDALSLALEADRASHLRFHGIYSHAGHAYKETNINGLRRVARQEALNLAAIKQRLEHDRLYVPVVHTGSTPSALVSHREDVQGVTHCSAGNYVFLDYGGIKMGLTGTNVAATGYGYHAALGVVSTIVSKKEKHLFCDAGSKVLSSDQGAHGSTGPGGGFGKVLTAFGNRIDADVTVSALSEEHGWIARREGDGLDKVEIGDRIFIIPNHSCTTVNLATHLHVTQRVASDSVDSVAVAWPVSARGCVY